METQTSIAKPRGGSRRRKAFAALIVVAVVLIAGVLIVRAQLDPGDPVHGMTNVAVRDDKFAPAAIEVPAGTTVTWHWEGKDQHNVVGDGLKSPTQAEGEFTYTFSEPGTFEYRCTRHFFMRGKVVVTD